MAPSCGCGPGRSPHPGCGCREWCRASPGWKTREDCGFLPRRICGGARIVSVAVGEWASLAKARWTSRRQVLDRPVRQDRQLSAGRVPRLCLRAWAGVIDRELYLRTCWIEDEARRADAKIGDEVGFATKQALARAMLARAIEAGVPFRWVTGDEAYGGDPVLRGWPMCWRSPTRTGWGRVAPTPAPWPRSCPPKPGRSAPPATAPAGCASTPGPPGPTGHLRQLGVRGRAVDPPLAHRR
jgi:hypothetical protein